MAVFKPEVPRRRPPDHRTVVVRARHAPKEPPHEPDEALYRDRGLSAKRARHLHHRVRLPIATASARTASDSGREPRLACVDEEPAGLLQRFLDLADICVEGLTAFPDGAEVCGVGSLGC